MSIYSLTKICSKCGQDKPLSEYNKHKANKDGLQYQCNSCRLEYRINNRNKIREKDRLYYHKTVDQRKQYAKQYRENNKSIRNEKERIRKQNDPLYKLSCCLRTLVIQSIKRKGYKKNTKTESILGCDWFTFKQYIENQFDDNMSWSNQGTYWDIDHIIPTSSAITEEDIIRLNHYTNLRPLESHYNRYIKRAKLMD